MATVSGIVVATGTQSTGRRSMLDLMGELARPVDASDTTVMALAGDAIRAAIRKMNSKGHWPWELQDEEINLTANNKFVTVNSSVKKPLRMHYLNEAGGTRNQPISYQPYDVFLEKYTVDVAAQPHTYTIPNLFETGQVRFYPTPAANYVAKFSYYRVTPAPRTEAETVEIPDYVTEAYMALAWVEFLKRLPSEQRPFNLAVALAGASTAFREIAAHVNAPGDRSRYMSATGDMG